MSPEGPAGAGRPRGGDRRRRNAGREQSHPGGAATGLGVGLVRFAGVQGASLVTTSLLQLATIIAVGWYLGPSDLGRYALLFFLISLIAQVIVVCTKPGTLRRVFGAGDDDDDDDDDESDLSDRPPWTLGVGLSLSVILSGIAIALIAVFSEPIADLLLGDQSHSRLVVWAGAAGGILAFFRLAEITLWFERRPSAFLAVDVLRPAIALGGAIAVLAAGGGLEGAIIANAAGTLVAALVAILLLRGSFEIAFDPREALQILERSRVRFPIVTSMWVIQNADVFLLSRFVSHEDLGVYQLASRLALVVAILPQGFRMALRPLRKGAGFRALRREYGQAVAQGQLLTYFALLCLSTVLLMVLAGELLVNVAPESFSEAGPLIPLAAAAWVMPALFRTVNQMSIYEGKRPVFIASCILAALVFVGLTLLLAPEIGIYAAPVGMLVGFALPTLYMFARSQRGKVPLDVPYRALALATVVAGVIAGAFQLLAPDNDWAQLAIVIALLALWPVLLFWLRIVPERHWGALAHMARSLVGGSAISFKARSGLRKLEPAERRDLREAVRNRHSPDALGDGADAAHGLALMRSLRCAGRGGGVSVHPESDHDAAIALFLFSDEPHASRQARMRTLLAEGASATDVHLLEQLVERLAQVPEDAWAGKRRAESGKRPRPRLRRA